MDYSRYGRILVEHRERVVTLTLNRPEQLNACDRQMHYELADIFYDVALDEDADVVVLTGAGEAFCSGGDMGWLAEKAPSSYESKRIVFGMLDLEKPIIARIVGPAVGLGASLALFCDLAFADETARIADPHVRIGLVAGDGGAIIWPQLIGFMRAKQYLFTGQALTGAEAARIGLINGAVPREELDGVVYKLAAQLAGGASRAIRGTKATVNIAIKQLAHSLMDAGMAYEVGTFASEDFDEGLRAFQEKRKPNFKGK